jgi:hypothetical protein
MKRQAEQTGSAIRTLTRGLELRYEQGQRIVAMNVDTDRETPKVEWYRVTLGRPVVHPSEQEVAIVRAAFGVPRDALRRDDFNQVVLEWET